MIAYYVCNSDRDLFISRLVSTSNVCGENLLWGAVRSPETVKFLIFEQRLDPLHLNNNGESVLFAAAGRGTVDVLELLLSYDLDVNHLNRRGSSALFGACFWGNKDNVMVSHTYYIFFIVFS